MSGLPDTWVSPEQYLTLEDEAESKSEYIDGVIYAMPGAMPLHSLIVANVIAELRSGLRGGRCRVYASDLKVTTPNRKRYFYPDASVICGELLLTEDRKDIVMNPTVMIEVLTPGTAAYDRGPKFLSYQTIPSLEDYVLVSQDERRVESYRRQGESWLYTRIEDQDASLVIASIGTELKLTEIYLGA